MLLDQITPEADAVFSPFGIDETRNRKLKHRQTSIRDYPLSLDFREICASTGRLTLATLTSTGVCAKNSARDILWEDASCLAKRMVSAIFR